MTSPGRWKGAASILLVSFLVAGGGAQSADLVNRSFENGTDPGEVAVLKPGSAAIDGWTVGGTGAWYVGSKWKPFLGVRSVGLPCGGTLSQTFATDVDQEYEIRFSMAGDPTTPPATKTVAVAFGTESRTFTFDASGKTFAEMGWEARFWVFTAIEPTTTLTFSSPKGECGTVALDNVRMAAVEIGVRAEPARRSPS
jgi:choice-of-anchor C domain-containing protein